MHHRHALPLPVRGLAGALLLLPASGCVLGEGLLGEYTETDTGAGTDAGTAAEPDSGSDAPACIEDCDPGFAVSHFSGGNYASQAIALLSTSTCVGPSCPALVSPVSPFDGTPIEHCPDTAEAQSSPLGPAEHCRIAASLLHHSIFFGFTQPVDRSSFEEVRVLAEPADLLEPDLPSPYYWHPEVAVVHGPGTVVRGDYERSSEHAWLSMVINETCAERLTALGIPWTDEELETLCVGTWSDGGVLRPLKMAPSMDFSSFPGELTTREGPACGTPDSGPDTCCSECDRMLGPMVARYGVDPAGARRNANTGTAIGCDPEGDVLIECRDLVLDVERDPGRSYSYDWNGVVQDWPLPRYDKLRETHPEDRPAGLANGPACTTADDCYDGQDCIGTNAAGDACHAGADCTARTCRAEWFGGCEVTAGSSAFCIDRRFDPQGAAACMVATTDFAHGVAGDRLSLCDTDGDGQASAAECCDPALGGAAGCDPFHQPNLVAVPRFDRDPSLPPEAFCVCEEGQPAACADAVDLWCTAPIGSANGPYPGSPPGDYAAPVVRRDGGVTWLAGNERLDLNLATQGGVPRAPTEFCADFAQRIGGRNPTDGWLANTGYRDPELFEDHDLALCSGSTYRLVLAESGAEHHIRSEAGETLDGRSEHVLETPQFRSSPLPPSPSPNSEEFTSCSSYWVNLSNAYDPSEANVRKLELHEGAPDGPRVAGGPDCDPLASPPEIAAGAIPCLGVDFVGISANLIFYIDESIHGQVLQTGTTYFVVLPGLADLAQMADAEAYAAAFHDVCGMPLIVGSTPEQLALWELSFTIEGSCS